MFEFNLEMNGKQCSRQIKDYMNQQLCSLNVQFLGDLSGNNGQNIQEGNQRQSNNCLHG